MTTQSKYYLNTATRTAKDLVPGGRTQTFWAENLLISRIDFDPGVMVPEHKHPHEQFGVIISGEVLMTIDGEPLTLRAGEMYLIPGNVPHSAEAGPAGFTAAEVFSPVRQDLKY